MDAKLIVIDGSIMEGGGQIIRIAFALSAILKKAVEVEKIRAGRPKPGLSSQHLMGINLVGNMCQGSELTGCCMGSTTVRLRPQPVRGGCYEADAVTAGSVCLLAQVALPCALFADSPVQLTLKGGTDADFAPPIDYFCSVFLPLLRRFAADVSCSLVRRGFFPKGRGEIRLQVQPKYSYNAIDLTDLGQVTVIEGCAYCAGNVPGHIVESMASAAERAIERSEFSGAQVRISRKKVRAEEAFGNGWGISVVARTNSGCVLGECGLGRPSADAQVVGRDAAERLLAQLRDGVCVDHHAQDQLILPMALARGRSRILAGPTSLHTQTAIYVTQLLTGVQFRVLPTGHSCGSVIIECDGIGLSNQFPTNSF